MEVDLYDDVFAPNFTETTKCLSEQNSIGQRPIHDDAKFEAIFKKLRSKNAGLVEELSKEKRLTKTLTKNLHSLLATARREIDKNHREIKMLKSELRSPFVVKCAKCRHKFDATNSRAPKPRYVKVMKSRCVVEVSFYQYEQLSDWIHKIGLARNSDDLPTLPEELNELVKYKQVKATLKNTNSTIVD